MTPPSRERVRVLVLTAPVGDGHLAAARALAADVLRRNAAAEVVVCDALRELPTPLRWFVGDAYRWQLHAAPWLFGALFDALRRSRVLRFVLRAMLSLLGSRSVRRLVRRHPADVVVSTWPPVTAILGSLRRRGTVRVPVCATITDFAGLELWANQGVDLHLVMHESLVSKVERLAGRDSACHVSPLVRREFLVPRSRDAARYSLDLPSKGIVVVVSGGGWGVGDLAGAVQTALRLDGSTVLCLAGRNEAAREHLACGFRDEPRVRVLGFTDRMSDVLAAADVLVHSTGGVTSLEAIVRGCPVVAYGAPRGHAPLLAREMAELGLVSHARSSSELEPALLAALRRPVATLTDGVDAAAVVLGLSPRVVAPFRTKLARATAMAASAAVFVLALMASDLTYPVVAEALALPDSSSISTNRRAVALVVRGSSRDLLAVAPLAQRLHVRASADASDGLVPSEVVALRRAGLEPIPELRTGGVGSWFGVRRQLEDQRARYGLGHSFHYVAPKEGFTLPDYLLGWNLGGVPIQGHDVGATDARGLASLHPGEVIVLVLDPDAAKARVGLLRAIRAIRQEGLAVSSVEDLAGRRDGS